MAQFGFNDTLDDAPKFVTNAATGETGQDEYGTAVFGVSAGEAGANNLTSGWIRRVEGTAGRAGRVDIEVLAALSGATAFASGDAVDFVGAAADPAGAADDAVIADPTITIGTAPAPTTVTDPDPATFTVVATTDGAGELTYQWQVDDQLGGGMVDIVGETSATLTIDPSTGLNGYEYQVVVSTNGAADVTTAPVVLTVNP